VDHALKSLGAVEGLLLLEQEGIADERETTDSLAVVWVGPWDTFSIGEVCRIVLTLASSLVTTDLRDHLGLNEALSVQEF